MITLDVVGLPAPQGSKSVMPNGMAIEGSSKSGRAKTKSWRAAVAETATAWLDAEEKRTGVRPAPLDGPLGIDIVFRFPPTKSDPYRLRHATKPDLDKILRATLDPLVHARIIRDDSFVWRTLMNKTYARDGQSIGAQILITSDAVHEATYRAGCKEAAKAERAAMRRAS